MGPAVYRALALYCAWTHAEWVDWTTATVLEQVFGVTNSKAGLESRG